MVAPIELQVSDANARSTLTPGGQYVWRVGYYASGDVLYTDWGDEFTPVSPITATIQSGQNIDIGTGKILYSNVYDTVADLPTASDYHGMFAHVHAEGAAYYAHAGNWVRLANSSSVPSSYISTLNGLSGAVTIGAGSGVTVSQAGSTLLISAAGAVTSVNAEAGALTLVGGDNIGIATQDGIITITGQASGVTWSTAPLMPTDPGSEGDIAYNDNYFFVRTGQGWRRTALSAWDAEILISSQPQNLSLQPGGSGNFTVTAAASDGSTVAYQWQNSDDNGVTWDTITGSTAATYGVSGVSLADNGTLFRVVLSAANITSVTSDSATLLVAESYDLLTEGSDALLTESGDYLSHDGNGTTSSGNWTQLGSDIDGNAAAFGNAVAMSSNGTRFVAGDWLAITEKGIARVYEWSGSSWSQVGSDIQGQYTGDRFGSAVAISSDGSRIVSGARYSDNGSSATADIGTVQVFDWSGSAWNQAGAAIVGEAAGDNFGQSVAISSDGSRIAVGAAGNDDAGSEAGHVRVFSWSGSAWTQLGADIDGQYAIDNAGGAVALSGDGSSVAIGAPGSIAGGSQSGNVRVFVWSGSAWTQRGADIDGTSSDVTGSSVSLSSDGTRLAIGSPGFDVPGLANAGGVRVYSWTGSAWTQLGSTIVGEATADYSGVAVSISSDGSRVAIGAPYNSDSASNAGTTRVYEWSGSAWVKLSTNMDGEAAGDFSGFGHHGVSLSGDGDTVAIGSAENGLYGHVRVYRLQ